MSPTRRDTMKAAGAVGTLAVLGGTAMANRHEEDDRPDEEREGMPEEGEAAVSVGHFSPGAPAVDIRLDDETVATGIEYGEVSEYMNVEAGTYMVQVLEAEAGAGPAEPGTPDDGTPTDDGIGGTPDDNLTEDTPEDDNLTVDTPEDNVTGETPDDMPGGDDSMDDREPLFEEEITVEETFYTVAAMGELEEDNLRAVVLEDYDVAQVRLIHTSPNAPAVDVTVEDSNLTLFDRVRLGESTDYVTVPGGDYTVEVREASPDRSGTVVDTFDLSVESGRAYSAYATGYVDADGGTGGGTNGTEDTPDGTETPDSDLPEDGVTDTPEDNGTMDTPDGTNGGGSDGQPPLDLITTIDGVSALTSSSAAGPDAPDDTDGTPGNGTDDMPTDNGTDDSPIGNGTDDSPTGNGTDDSLDENGTFEVEDENVSDDT